MSSAVFKKDSTATESLNGSPSKLPPKALPRIVLTMAQAVREAVQQAARRQSDWDPSDLAGGCGAASYALTVLLGPPARFVQGEFRSEYHCWVDYAGQIIDVTATQFGVVDKVFVPNAAWAGWYAERRSFAADDEVGLRDFFAGWAGQPLDRLVEMACNEAANRGIVLSSAGSSH